MRAIYVGERFCTGGMLSAGPEALPFGPKLTALPAIPPWQALAGWPGDRQPAAIKSVDISR